MQFFLNRSGGHRKYTQGDSEFFEYFYRCAIYNIIWDLQEVDENAATFYWDEDLEAVAVKFPDNGTVMKELRNRKIKYFFEE